MGYVEAYPPIDETRLDPPLPGQLSIFDELASRRDDLPDSSRSFLAGAIAHLSTSDDDRVRRIGRVARRELNRETARQRPLRALVWKLLLDASIEEWLRRHPPL